MTSDIFCTADYSSSERGFTLIEVIIVTTILAILASISLYTYQGYAGKATNSACLSEAKNYANVVAAALHTPDVSVPAPPNGRACESFGPTPTSFTDNVTAVAKSPGNGNIICDMSGVAVCSLLP